MRIEFTSGDQLPHLIMAVGKDRFSGPAVRRHNVHAPRHARRKTPECDLFPVRGPTELYNLHLRTSELDSSFNPSASVWKNGVLTDLNELIRGKSVLYLLIADAINGRGEIVGFGATSSGDLHGFLAIPSHWDHDDCDDSGNADCR